MSEFTRMIDLREIGNAPVAVTATPAECAALAKRFALVAVERLSASVMLNPVGQDVKANGRFTAAIVQSCAVSGEDLPSQINEPLALRFVPAQPIGAAELELTAEDLDEIEFSGTAFDLGEAVAQTLALAIDPFAIGPQAEEARRKAGLLGENANNPFAGLLKK
jgi:uncharacterized metal-binding protein YceD (DUF177 family)